ncbi:hypothetical protein BCR34DRAFT_236351 [Clohesyomyces aquaticus]|uniref:Uncharacterized protein n=1 Tax=Clohesyomyces aquaticus TaxID=1231657 RepID=A0A1Y1Y694_9PLEO|nr:hypothetical protein BCR34DRAFT_236351 [Clohesyomyces aquaticus]
MSLGHQILELLRGVWEALVLSTTLVRTGMFDFICLLALYKALSAAVVGVACIVHRLLVCILNILAHVGELLQDFDPTGRALRSGTHCSHRQDLRTHKLHLPAQESVRAEFWPDSVAFDESREVFCAELIRGLVCEKKYDKSLSAVWSNDLGL